MSKRVAQAQGHIGALLAIIKEQEQRISELEAQLGQGGVKWPDGPDPLIAELPFSHGHIRSIVLRYASDNGLKRLSDLPHPDSLSGQAGIGRKAINELKNILAHYGLAIIEDEDDGA